MNVLNTILQMNRFGTILQKLSDHLVPVYNTQSSVVYLYCITVVIIFNYKFLCNAQIDSHIPHCITCHCNNDITNLILKAFFELHLQNSCPILQSSFKMVYKKHPLHLFLITNFMASHNSFFDQFIVPILIHYDRGIGNLILKELSNPLHN